jgi:hypothetical protein
LSSVELEIRVVFSGCQQQGEQNTRWNVKQQQNVECGWKD